MEIGIVGGGIGALTTALLLSKRGFQVTIYEKEAQIGGRIAYQMDDTGKYRIDRGPTIVLLPDMLLSILEEGGIERSRLPLMECDPLYKIHYSDGTSFTKHRNLELQLAELDRCFPGEKDGFLRYMQDMEEAFTSGADAFLNRPFVQKGHFYTWHNMKLLLRMKAYKSVRALAADYFQDERLQDAFSLQTLYIGGAPFKSPGLYTLIPYAEHAFGVWYLKGGYAGLISILRDELEKRGVKIITRCPVDRILIEQGQCRGISSGGKVYLHDSIIFNGDFPYLADLMPEGAKGAESAASIQERTKKRNERMNLRKSKKSYEPSSGCFLIYLGLNKRWAEAGIHQFFLPESLNNGLRQLFVDQQVPNEPAFYSFYPTALDEEAAPDGESVLYLLVPVPPAGEVAWEGRKDQLTEYILDEAERRGFPGLREAIQWMDIRTPDDAEREGMYRGGSFGIAPSLGQSAVFRPQIVPYPAIQGLYSVGASVHPGGGVPIVMQGARLLADYLTKEREICSTKSV